MGTDYHFNEWAFLAQADPAAFERRRRQYLDDFIRGSGRHRRRLEALQAAIDAERRPDVPLQQTILMLSSLMCESLNELQAAVSSLADEVGQLDKKLADQLPALPLAHSAIAGPARRQANG
jgi:hypothetical protein